MVSTRPELVGDHGMVASTHWLASAVGMSVLERGGNAADAAVATGFVLAVVEPHLNGPGGEVPILLWDPDTEDVSVVAGQGVLPEGATIEHYRSLGLDLVPGSGLLAATVPGAFGAWLALLERWGTWSLRAVLEPALGYAENGWPVLPAVSATIARVAALFTSDWTHSAATWLPDGRPPAPGARMRNPELAATWRRLLAEAEAAGADRSAQIEAARRAFYAGFVAEAIDGHCRNAFRDSSGERHAGVLRGADLAGWSVPIEASTSVPYAGEYEVHKTGPWGQGPVFLQQLALLDGFELAAAGHLSADYIHTVLECAKLAFADREAWYGDGADVPLDTLLSAGYAAERRALVGSTASPEFRPGAPGGRAPRLPALAEPATWDRLPRNSSGTTGEPTAAAAGRVTNAGAISGDTCHLDVLDRSGLMISATPSGGWLPSSPTVPGLGFCLNSRAQMSWLEPGVASSLRPGHRPRTTLSPSIALRDGRPYLAFGTPGGDQQDQWTLLFFLAHVHFGLDLQQAIDAPAFHSVHYPSSFWPREGEPAGVVIESRVPGSVRAELARRGHVLRLADDWALGRLSAVGPVPGTGFLRAAADSRGAQAYAVGR